MLYRLIPALFLVLALALLFSHPSPFREPEYLQKRERLLHHYREKIGPVKLQADFNKDHIPDSAYVAIVQEGPDSGTCFLRFNHFIPSIELDEDYYTINYLEKVPDLNKDSVPELYFVAVKKKGCKATGFLYLSENKSWKEETAISQNGCREYRTYGSYVETRRDGKFRIEYQQENSSYDEFYEGRVN